MFARLSAFLFAVLFAASLPAFATDYYVSPHGNDFLFGTSTLSPWASIARVNRAGLRSGDRVYFLRGGTWRETLQPQASGLYFGAYGTGARPVISGADQLGPGLFTLLWFPSGTNVWSYPVSSAPTQVWFNGVLGTRVSSQAQVQVQVQWFYGSGRVFIYSNGLPELKFTAPGVEASTRNAFNTANLTGVTAEHLAFVNGADVDACLCSGTNGQVTFNDVVFSGALNEGLRVLSGSPVLTTSELINNGAGMKVSGGNGFTLTESLLSGNRAQAITVDGTTSASSITSSTVSGNSTASPNTYIITNFSSFPLTASNSILLPNPYQPKIYGVSGLTDAGNNVTQSPEFKQRAANLIVVPFVDDYNNLPVAQAVAQAAQSYGCKLSYALNTKLVTPAAWTQIAQLQSTGVEIVAHTRSHSDLANNNVFAIQYTGPATQATMTINQTSGLLLTYLNGSSTPDLSLPISNTYAGIIDIINTIPAGSPYQVVIQTNQNYFTPVNLANVASVSIKSTPYMAQAGPGYLTWEVEGAKADLVANLPGYKPSGFATPFTSSSIGVENHIHNAGFSSNRNGLLTPDSQPNGNWVLSTPFDVYNVGAEWLPFSYDATNPASSAGALVEGLGAAGGVLAVYSHGYDEFTLQNWNDFFATLKQIGGTCMTMSQANAYIEANGKLIPDGTSRNWLQTVPLNPDYSVTPASPTQGARDLE